MPIVSQENKAMLILNMIYERQIKRVADYIYLDDRGRSYLTSMNQDLFVLSVSDPTVFLDYASISHLNVTLDDI